MGGTRRVSDPEIIGRGTWYDKAAAELIEREKRLGRSLDLVRTESGLGASGFPHIRSLGDALRNYAVAMAVRVQGYDSELIAFADDKDGLRKVPAGLPDEMEKWLGYPVSDIPDIFGDCHDSFGYHMSSLLLEAMDIAGVDVKLDLYEGMPHVFQATPHLPESKVAVGKTAAFLKQHLQ